MWGVRTPDTCRNFRPSELPTYVGTPDPHGIWKLAVGLWSSIPDTSGMNTGHVRYDQDSEPSKSIKMRNVKTPDLCRNSRPSELPTNQPKNNNFTTTDTSGMNTEHVRYCQTSKNKVSSFVAQILKTHMGWLEHLWNIINQYDASLLIVWHFY